MTLNELLADIRQTYLTLLVEAFATERTAGATVHPEPLLRNAEGDTVKEGALELPLRVDLVSVEGKDGTGVRHVDSEALVTFDAFEFEWAEGLTATIAPFHWDRCVLRMAGGGKMEWAPLVSWFERWIDLQDTHPEGSDGTLGVLHFLSDPSPEDGATRMEVDLGSAPTDCFVELLDACAQMGVTELAVAHE
ncbi:MAG: hypothetical protein MO852_15950 [Candidatus Devosia euplotis]|nr:hypothetical protein [Candidatus Devosia euplotis]